MEIALPRIPPASKWAVDWEIRHAHVKVHGQLPRSPFLANFRVGDGKARVVDCKASQILDDGQVADTKLAESQPIFRHYDRSLRRKMPPIATRPVPNNAMEPPCYTEGVTSRLRRRRNQPAMARPDPNKIRLAGSGATSDWMKMLSVIVPVLFFHVMVPTNCGVPFSTALHPPGKKTGTTQGPRPFASPNAFGRSEVNVRGKQLLSSHSLLKSEPGVKPPTKVSLTLPVALPSPNL